MEEGLSIFIASGITSSLFASLLPMLTQYKLYAPIRHESNPTKIQALKDANVVFVESFIDIHTISFDRILWLSTHHGDMVLLEKYATDSFTLAINSGAILDILSGKQDEATTNIYQKSKLALYNVPKLYNFIPGFFIQDIADPGWASKGLHGDTTAKLFSAIHEYDGPDFDWMKAYAVTPKSHICSKILAWINEPLSFEKTTIVSSEKAYTRKELREFELLPSNNNKTKHGVSQNDVISACRAAHFIFNKEV